MILEKEVIRPGAYFYCDQTTGQPRKLTVTPELTKYWHDQGNAMLSSGLTVPVPFEHDFDAHPMTPAEKLQNNAGWVSGYKLKDVVGKDGKKIKDVLFSSVDIRDNKIIDKLPSTIRWTSPWINSFTDGKGKEWKNVISHLALTLRPRIVDQEPFGSVAAALSMAEPIQSWGEVDGKGACLSLAGLLKKNKGVEVPKFPMAFSLMTGIPMATTYEKSKVSQQPPPMNADTDNDGDVDADVDGDGDTGLPDDGDPSNDDVVDLPPIGSPAGDVKMSEVLCDLLGALGIQCEHSDDEATFKRSLYNAAMTKIHELTGKAQTNEKQPGERDNPPGSPPNNPKQPQQKPGQQPNPIIQQEQQPMYMSLEEINKLPDPMRGLALSLYKENQKIRQEAEADRKKLNSLNERTLREEDGKRQQRVALLGKLAPRAKGMLDQMLASPAMALSMGEGGRVVDPMATTLEVLEKGLADMPTLLTTDQSALSVHAQPTDADLLSDEKTDAIADSFARSMGCPPITKAG